MHTLVQTNRCCEFYCRNACKMNIIGSSLEHLGALNLPVPLYRRNSLFIPWNWLVLTSSLSNSTLYRTGYVILFADAEKFLCSALPFSFITLLIVPVADSDILLKPCVLRRSVLRSLFYYLFNTPFCGTVRLARRGTLRLGTE